MIHLETGFDKLIKAMPEAKTDSPAVSGDFTWLVAILVFEMTTPLLMQDLPTKHITISESQHPPIDVFEQRQIQKSTDFQVL